MLPLPSTKDKQKEKNKAVEKEIEKPKEKKKDDEKKKEEEKKKLKLPDFQSAAKSPESSFGSMDFDQNDLRRE